MRGQMVKTFYAMYSAWQCPNSALFLYHVPKREELHARLYSEQLDVAVALQIDSQGIEDSQSSGHVLPLQTEQQASGDATNDDKTRCTENR